MHAQEEKNSTRRILGKDGCADPLVEAGEGARKAISEGQERPSSISAINDAASSTQSSSGERDPQMCQTRKCQEHYIGMKMHIGVDESLGLIHKVKATAANVHDVAMIDLSASVLKVRKSSV